VLEEALTRGTPEMFNTNQGAQYTAKAFTNRLELAGVAISMDGRGRRVDNVFVERLWRTVKYECVYLHDYATVRALEGGWPVSSRSATTIAYTRPWIASHRRQCTRRREACNGVIRVVEIKAILLRTNLDTSSRTRGGGAALRPRETSGMALVACWPSPSKKSYSVV